MQTRLLEKMKYVTGTADLRIQQPFDEPYLRLQGRTYESRSSLVSLPTTSRKISWCR